MNDGTQETTEADPLADLLTAAARGDRDAFAELYNETAGRLTAVVSRILGYGGASDEVLQETFLTIWRKADRYRAERGNAMAWMVTIARNHAIDRLRRDKTAPRDFAAWDERGEGELAQHIGETGWPIQVSDAIHECLKELKDIQRKAILLAYYYGMTHEELAVQLASPLDTIKSWVRRGLLQLKECVA